MATLNDRTPGGVLAYCDYLIEKGYATRSQINPWRTAVQRVFGSVDPDGWESADLSSIDLDEYLERFRVLQGAKYKAESVITYGKRVQNAIHSHRQYLDNGRPPAFRPRARRGSAAVPGPQRGPITPVAQEPPEFPAGVDRSGETEVKAAELVEFPYPLGDGRMAVLRLPPRLEADDVNRLTAFIRTLQVSLPPTRLIEEKSGSR